MDGSDRTASSCIICSTSKKSDVDWIYFVLIFNNSFVIFKELITEYRTNIMLFSIQEKGLWEVGWMC